MNVLRVSFPRGFFSSSNISAPKISAIKYIRQYGNYSLKDAKELVDRAELGPVEIYIHSDNHVPFATDMKNIGADVYIKNIEKYREPLTEIALMAKLAGDIYVYNSIMSIIPEEDNKNATS